jgi:large subunit ribosomal protein L4
MIVDLINLDTEKKSSHELNDAIFGLEPRKDILHRVVTWQLSKRRSGSHKTKTRGEIKGSTRKIMKQKGSGSARHSTRKVNIFRGGGVAFGPLLRDHSTKLPKKIRSLGLKLALSSKAKNKELVVLDERASFKPKLLIFFGSLVE